MNNKYFLGIDLGTTNTVASVGTINPDTNQIDLIPVSIQQLDTLGNPTTKEILPSLLYVDEDNCYLGQFAKVMKEQNSKKVICNIKRWMGTNLVRKIKNRIFYPYEVSAEYLKACRESANDDYLYSFTEAVITVPASYGSGEREHTSYAAELAGFDGVYLLEEPTAALIDYVYSTVIKKNESSINFKDKKRMLVYDIGGGTSDISVIDVQVINGEINIDEKAKSRHADFGGINFDKECAKHLLQKIINDKNIDETKLDEHIKNEMESKLMIFAEYAKESFSKKIKNGNINISELFERRIIPEFYNEQDMDVLITYDEYVKYIEKLLYRPKEEIKTVDDIEKNRNVESPILETLLEYDINMDSIDYVYLTGGMSNFPLIKERVKEILQTKNEIIMAENPFESVARGAAIYSYYKDKIKQTRLANKTQYNSLNDMVSYIKQPEIAKYLEDNIGEIKIKNMLRGTIMVNTLDGLPKVLISNQQYPCEEKTLENILKTTSTSGIRLEVFSGANIYDTNMTIQKIYSKKFNNPVSKGTKIDIKYSLDENARLHMKLIVKDKNEEQIIPLSSFETEKPKVISNHYNLINNIEKKHLFYRQNVPEDYIKKIETIFKDYVENSDDSSNCFMIYLKLESLCGEMLNKGINPIETLLYTSKICNNILETQYNLESDFGKVIATIITGIIKKDLDSSKKIIDHILNNWSWIPQLKMIYNACVQDEELLQKCYDSYKNKKLEKSILKYEILDLMISSAFPRMIDNIYEVISDLNEEDESDVRIYNDLFSPKFAKKTDEAESETKKDNQFERKSKVFECLDENCLKKLYDLCEKNYLVNNFSKKIMNNFRNEYERKYGIKNNKINQIIEELDSSNLKIRREVYREAYKKKDSRIINKIYTKLGNNEEDDEKNIGYALIAIGKSIRSNEYLQGKEKEIKDIFNRYENNNNKGYLLSCYASQVISNLYEEKINDYYQKVSQEIIDLDEYVNNRGYVDLVVRTIKNIEFNDKKFGFVNYLSKYIKNSINKNNDCEQLKTIINNYLSIRNYLKGENIDEEILKIWKRKNLKGNIEELYLTLIEFKKITKNNSNMDKYDSILLEIYNGSKYSKNVKIQASEVLKQVDIKDGESCG